jgi:hypothetical protein
MQYTGELGQYFRHQVRRARQHSTAPAQRLGFERIDEGPPLPLRRDPFILHAHPPARLGVGVVDKHQPGLVYKAFALLHHHLAILIEEGVHPAAEWRRLEPSLPRSRRVAMPSAVAPKANVDHYCLHSSSERF